VLIRKLRLQRGWSQEQLAELTGLSVRTIQRVERGYPPSLETRNALAAVFETDLAELIPAEQTMADDRNTEEVLLKGQEAWALEYVQGLKAFYQHLLLYIFLMFLFAGGIFLVHGFIPAYIQFMLVGWGIGLLFHGLNAFEVFNFFGPAWERKKVEKRLGRKL
jgi:transcriptional regulator with XRE-family HTH domain